MRIDVDNDPTRSHPIRRQPQNPATPPAGWPNTFSQGYSIPNDNPWLAPDGSHLEEFYAIGLRSPHRAILDPETGNIWIGDVGQGKREEVSVAFKGANMQWPYREGFINGSKSRPDSLIGIDTPPVYDYGRSVGNCVIGGFVYRGEKWNSLLGGKYIFGDHSTRNVWSMDYNESNGNTNIQLLVNVPFGGVGDKSGISAFSTDTEGNVYVFKLFGTDLDGGIVYKMQPRIYVPEPPLWLSQTGVFADLENVVPQDGIIPYTVNSPLWSDRAVKKRWIAIPNDGTHDTASEQVVFSENNEWEFPEGTVLIKHFELPLDENNPSVTRKLETRLMVRIQDGSYYGLTYKWNEDGTDARLLTLGESETYNVTLSDQSVIQQTWDYPSRSDCATCHTGNAGYVLGVKTHQLNGDLLYESSGVTDNQLRVWNHLGIFNVDLNENQLDNYPASVPLDHPTASLENKVRSYLDANCAHCHQPNGVSANFDARISTPLSAQNLINGSLVRSYDVPDGVVVKPGDLSKSILHHRDNSVEEDAMPPIARNLVDETYINTLEDWINSLGSDEALNPVVNLSTSATSGNAPLTISFDASGSSDPNGNTLAYHWNFGDKNQEIGNATNHTYNTPGTYNVILTVTNENGGLTEVNTTIEVFSRSSSCPDPIISVLSQDLWTLHYVNSEETVGEDGRAINAFDGNPYTIWHTEWANGNHPHELQINLNATETISGFRYLPRQNGDLNGTIDLYRFYVSNDGTNWQEVATGLFDVNTQEKEVTFDPIDAQYVRIVALSEVNGNPWTSMAELNVLTQTCPEVENRDPIADISATPISGDAPLVVSFDASGSSDPDGHSLTYSWNFGDGNQGNGSTISHTYTTPGTYNVSLTISDGNGGIDQANTSIEVLDSGPDPCANPTVSLLSQDLWTLHFVDSEETTGEDGKALNAFDGNPSTIWHTSWSTGNPTHPHDLQININASEILSGFRYQPRVDGSTNGAISQYSFYVSNDGNNWQEVAVGTFSNNIQEKEVTFDPVEAQYIRLVALGEVNGNPWTSVPELNVLTQDCIENQSPTANISATPISGDAPLVVSFDAAGSSDPNGNPLTYSWNFGDGNQDSGSTVSHTYSTPGTYEVTLTVDNGNGGTDQASTSIQVSDSNPDPCANATVSLLSQDLWTLHFVSSEETAGEDGKALNAFDGDPFTIWHTAWSTGNPAHPHDLQININASEILSGFRYQPRVDGSTNGVISQYSFYVSNDGSNWQEVATGTFDNNTQEKEVTFDPVQAQYIRLVALGEVNGNPWTSMGELNILTQDCLGEPDPVANISATPTSGDAPLVVSFDASGSSDPNGGTLTYSWNFGDGNQDSGSTVSHTYSTPGTYNVTLTVDNGNGGIAQANTSIQVSDGSASPCLDPVISLLSQSQWTLHYVDSEETAGEDGAALNAFDGDLYTLWHTAWSTGNPTHPHELQINLNATEIVSGFRYQPRVSGPMNGTIGQYAFYVSDDGNNWQEVATGAFESNMQEKEVTFNPIEAQYVRLVALSEVNGNPWTSVAELNVLVQDCQENNRLAYDSNEIFERKWEVFPNPFSNELTVAVGQVDNLKLQVYNMNGQLVFEQNYRSISSQLKIQADWPAGVYSVRLNDGEKIENFRLIKKR